MQASAASRSDLARDLLLRSMEKSRNIPMTAIVLQKPPGAASSVQVKLEQSREGELKVTVIQPLNMQGVSSIDDGRSWRTYLPDRRHIIVQESPRLQMPDPKERMALAERNYDFRLAGYSEIAGRRAACVVATPRQKALPVRKYFIDDTTSVLMRLETVENGATTTLYDTKLIQYVKDLPKPALNTVGNLRHFTFPSPEAFTAGPEARAHVGFNAILPSNLPFGFKIEGPQIAGGDDFRFVAVRVSDGLINGTVYQWSTNRVDVPKEFEEQKGDKKVKGVSFRFIADVPEPVRNQVIDVFIRDAQKKLKLQAEELGRPVVLLNGFSEWSIGMLLFCLECGADGTLRDAALASAALKNPILIN